MGYVLSSSFERDVVETVRIVALLHQVHLVTAHSADELVELARRDPPRLAVWEISPSAEDGRALLKWRTTPQLRSVPLLFLTPPDATDLGDLGDLGAAQVLSRPFSLVDLGLRLAALLGNSRIAPDPCDSPFLQVGDLILDCNMYQVHIPPQVGRAEGQANEEGPGERVDRAEGRTINLTPMEFRLLHYLMRSPGRVFTGDHLLARVWEYPEDVGNPDVVRMYVKRLRDKIEPDPRQPVYIRTVPGHGYTIPAPGATEAPTGPRPAAHGSGHSNGQTAYVPDLSVDEVLAAVLETTASCRVTLESVLATLGRRPSGVDTVIYQPHPPAISNGVSNGQVGSVPPAAVLAATHSLAQVVTELRMTLGGEAPLLHPAPGTPEPAHLNLPQAGMHPQ